MTGLLFAIPIIAAAVTIPSDITPSVIVDTSAEPIPSGKFEPTWKSLSAYEVPEWFRDAKFGIWAHWGPQCQPEASDWYARHMYAQGHAQYKAHLARYGHPSEAGFKEVIHEWKAEHWDPAALLRFYKKNGARYFFAMANHHDNFDLWDSRHHEWNSVDIGPKKNIIAGWADAARREGLPFGLSVHAAHAWLWWETAQGTDKDGPKAGVPYDGKLTKADGKGKWWDGLDPQKLYAQDHTPSPDFQNMELINKRWNWGEGASQPDAAYCQSFYDRTADLIRRYQPELVYYDDTALPLWPVSDAGVKLAALLYNENLERTHGRSAGVVFGKILTPDQKDAIVWDVEKGAPPDTQEKPWQTCTCIGEWHYNRALYDNNRYKSPAIVIRSLADVVSKNGNLLLNVPMRGDGTIDDKEAAIVERIGEWLKINGEAIYGTRPWKIFGEGPARGEAINAQGFNEGQMEKLGPADVRYTTKGGTLYAISLGRPTEALRLEKLGTAAGLLDGRVTGVRLVGSNEPVKWTQSADALDIEPPKDVPMDEACVFAVQVADAAVE